jgi:ACS family glucarate transporter-like MFS transporter
MPQVMPPVQRVRGRVLAFVFVLAAITYLDRICISAAAPFIMADLGLSVLEMSAVFSAFTLSYSLFEIPSGWLGDVKGPRRVLTRIVLWWSAFTMLTGAAQGFRSLVAIRFLFGAGEAGAFPNIARSISTWFPPHERGRANGVLFLGSRLGGMLSAPLALFVIAEWGWRASFVVFGLLGVVWAAAWHAWYRDRPEAHPAITREELIAIQVGRTADRVTTRNPRNSTDLTDPTDQTPQTPWRALLGSRNLYAICLMYFAFGYGLYFYFTWLPTFLIKELGFSLLAGGVFAALPFLLAGMADLVGGWLTDRLTRDYGLRVGRCYLGFAAFLTCAALVLTSTLPLPPVAKAVLLAFALASADLALGACWAVPMDIAPNHAGVVTGCMNTLGNLGGFVGPIVVGLALERWQSWTFPFYITAAVYAGGAVAWLFIDPTRALAVRRGGGQAVTLPSPDTRSRPAARACRRDR